MKKRRMSRGTRLTLNLVLLCVLVVFIWGLLGFSSPTLRGRFRRVAQANWADPLEIQGVLPCDGQRWVLAAGTGSGDPVAGWAGRPGVLARDPEWGNAGPVPEMRTAQGEIWVAAADVPAGTASARAGTDSRLLVPEKRDFRLDLQQPAGAAPGICRR